MTMPLRVRFLSAPIHSLTSEFFYPVAALFLREKMNELVHQEYIGSAEVNINRSISVNNIAKESQPRHKLDVREDRKDSTLRTSTCSIIKTDGIFLS